MHKCLVPTAPQRRGFGAGAPGFIFLVFGDYSLSELTHQHDGTLFIDQVDLLDVGIWTEHGPLGSTFAVKVQLTGPLDHMGFVCDFSQTKTIIKTALKTHIDHRFLAPIKDPHYSLTMHEARASWHRRDAASTYAFTGPATAVYAVDASHITSAIIEDEVTMILARAFAEAQLTITALQVSLREESPPPGDASYLRYTHGISAHQGLCHRMWHGHRSKVLVMRNHERSPALERYLQAELFAGQGFHLAEPDQIKGQLWQPATLGPPQQSCTIAYATPEGTYEAVMPAQQVFLMDQHTSVEALAWTLARKLQVLDPLATIEVRLYEGLAKGGICRLGPTQSA